MDEPSRREAAEEQPPTARPPARPTRGSSPVDVAATIVLTLLLIAMGAMSAIFGTVTMISLVTCRDDDPEQPYVCSHEGFGVTYHLLTYGLPLLAVVALVAMLRARRRKSLYGLTGVALILLAWGLADVWTDGLLLTPMITSIL